MVLIWNSGSSSKLIGCWQNLVPCSCRIEVPTFFLSFFSVYLFLRESQRVQGRGREKGGQRIWSRLCTDSREPVAGLKLTNPVIMTWAKVSHLTNWATQASQHSCFLDGCQQQLFSGPRGHVLFPATRKFAPPRPTGEISFILWFSLLSSSIWLSQTNPYSPFWLTQNQLLWVFNYISKICF